MSDQSSPSADPTGIPPPRRHRRWSWATLTALALVSALAGAGVSRAVAYHHWHGPGFLHGPVDPARAEERAGRAVKHLARWIDASSEQQEKLSAIAKAAVKDLHPVREKALSARQRGQQLLAQPAIDRAAIETLRTEQLALADTASKRVAQAIGDAAEVLTPEQRSKIDERLTRLQEYRGFWHRWWRS